MARKTKANSEDLVLKKKKFEKIAGNLEEIPVEKFLKDNFLPYAWSYSLDRALSNVTGLKPVQRRILYTMYKDGLTPNSGRSKVATLAGRVLAYHPHGDASVADALKNLARPHIFRVPLIDGKGDFGVPGTPGAAGRYIEARLNRAAWINVEELAENAVSMVPNYDNQTTEPVNIPVKWPVSLINGGSGIASGYASNMPSHNPSEIMKACKALLRNPATTDAALAKIILGPDFNMGGFIPSNEGIIEYLKTGSGKFTIRGNYTVEDRPRGASRIEFHEIPFGTNPEMIITKIQEAISDKGKFKDVSSFKNLSDLKHPIRIVVDTKPGVNYKTVLQDLFTYTPLETPFTANITTIVNNRPQRSSMKELILDFIAFRKQCVSNKLNHALSKKSDRLHLIEGLLKTLLDIDAAIAIIRRSEDAEKASASLMRKFKIDKPQAEYVLSLQLRRLTKMDSVELKNEAKKLKDEIAYFKKVLNDPEELKNFLLKEFDETLKVIGDERKTEIGTLTEQEFKESVKLATKEVSNSAKPTLSYVTRFADGRLIRSDAPHSYEGVRKIQYSPIVDQFAVMSDEHLVIVGSDGIGRRIPATYIAPNLVSTAVKAGVSLPKGVEVVGIAKDFGKGFGLAIGTEKGIVKIAKPDWKKDEFPAISLSDGDKVLNTRWLESEPKGKLFYFATRKSNILTFDAGSVRPSGSPAGGVAGVKITAAGDRAVSFGFIEQSDGAMVLSRSLSSVKLTALSEIPTKGRATQGVALQGLDKDEHLVGAYVGTNPVVAASKIGALINNPPATPRARKGVKIPGDVDFGSRGALVEGGEAPAPKAPAKRATASKPAARKAPAKKPAAPKKPSGPRGGTPKGGKDLFS